MCVIYWNVKVYKIFILRSETSFSSNSYRYPVSLSLAGRRERERRARRAWRTESDPFFCERSALKATGSYEAADNRTRVRTRDSRNRIIALYTTSVGTSVGSVSLNRFCIPKYSRAHVSAIHASLRRSPRADEKRVIELYHLCNAARILRDSLPWAKVDIASRKVYGRCSICVRRSENLFYHHNRFVCLKYIRVSRPKYIVYF